MTTLFRTKIHYKNKSLILNNVKYTKKIKMFIQNIIGSIKSANTIELFILIIATCISTYIFNFYYKYYTRPNPLPGPFPLPYIGNGHNYGDVKKFYDECQQKYGDICELMLDRRYIILSRPE